MDRYPGLLFAIAIIVGIFLAVQMGALALVEPLKDAGFQTVEDPQDPTNSLLYIGAILVMTAVMLAAFRYDVQWAIRGLIVLVGVYISWIVLALLVPPVVTVGGVHLVALAGATGLGLALLVHPEWYVIDVAGAVMGAGAAGLFGITFGVLPALVLLTVLAVYDAISVYGTEHMLTLASGVMDLNVPVVLVAPTTTDYSFIEDSGPETATPDSAAEQEPDRETEAPLEERDALFIGLGDAVIPTVLVASAAFFAPSSVPVLGVAGATVALTAVTAMIGTFVGLSILLWMVLKGRAHAGLPLLNGGAITGYLLGALASGLTLVEALGLGPYL